MRACTVWLRLAQYSTFQTGHSKNLFFLTYNFFAAVFCPFRHYIHVFQTLLLGQLLSFVRFDWQPRHKVNCYRPFYNRHPRPVKARVLCVRYIFSLFVFVVSYYCRRYHYHLYVGILVNLSRKPLIRMRTRTSADHTHVSRVERTAVYDFLRVRFFSYLFSLKNRFVLGTRPIVKFICGVW